MKTFISLVALILTFSCGSIENLRKIMVAEENNWIQQNCNYDAAYSTGVGDAYNDAEFNNSIFQLCNPTQVGKLKKAYAEGFAYVKNNPINTFIDLNEPKIYVCKITPFIKSFKASSENRGKAKLLAQNKCEKELDAMHCKLKDIKCTKVS